MVEVVVVVLLVFLPKEKFKKVAHIVATHTMNGGNIVSRKPTRHIFHAFEKREKEMDHKFLASYIRSIDLLPTFVHETKVPCIGLNRNYAL